HFLTQIPQPMQRNSDMKAILSVGFTSIQSLPERPIVSHTFLHSCAQRLGLQRLSSTIAIRVILSAIGGDESKIVDPCTALQIVDWDLLRITTWLRSAIGRQIPSI
ncbi:hypothetical protein EDB86DRAFT_2798919, partial [Lactarius hatsudake]